MASAIVNPAPIRSSLGELKGSKLTNHLQWSERANKHPKNAQKLVTAKLQWRSCQEPLLRTRCVNLRKRDGSLTVTLTSGGLFARGPIKMLKQSVVRSDINSTALEQWALALRTCAFDSDSYWLHNSSLRDENPIEEGGIESGPWLREKDCPPDLRTRPGEGLPLTCNQHVTSAIESVGKMAKEPFDLMAMRTDGKVCSSPESSLKDGDKPTNSSIVSPFEASAGKTDSSTSRVGVLITAGHFFLAAVAVVLVDYQLLANAQFDIPFRLTLPFFLSAGVTAVFGYFFVPVLEYFKAAQIFRMEGPASHKAKIGTPTLGGLFFIPVGVAVAGLFTGFKSTEVQGAVITTIAFAGIGFLDDSLALWRKHNYGLPGGIKLMMQVAVGVSLFFWLELTNLSYPHKIKHVVWLPAPFGRLHLGSWYLPLTAFSCAAMSNGVNLTDGLDGLAGGTAAVTFIAMSVSVFPLFPALGVFGTSMAGACFGFLVHNRYKAKVFMGDTGSLALGGALAAMACCTGMFFPLFIASGVFVIETLSVIGQVFYFKLTRQMYGEGRRMFRMSPFHHHLELVGLKEPIIVLVAYGLSSALGILVAYLVHRRN